MPSPRHTALVAAAGSGKTQRIVEAALDAVDSGERVLVTTYTNENRNQLERRICELAGVVPPRLEIATWLAFVTRHLCHPYQFSFLNEAGVVRSIDFKNTPPKYAKKVSRDFYLNKANDLFVNRATAFALTCNQRSGGRVIERLESVYSSIFVDEMQDLAGYDFDLLDLLLHSKINLYLVGDPRQALYFTDDSPKNSKYKGPGFVAWFDKRSALCAVETLTTSHRCAQAILDWADDLFPEYARTTSIQSEPYPSAGVKLVPRDKVLAYVADYGSEVTVLRQQKNTDTLGLPAINIGVSKGSTFPHVVIFGSGPMVKYATGELELADLKQRSRLYVAVTRARHTVAIVV